MYCEICKSPTKLKGSPKNGVYRRFCSKKCQLLYIQADNFREKRKQTNLIKYGCEENLSHQETREKISKTNTQKYGSTYFTQTDLYKEKSKQTCLEKYGVEHIGQVDQIKEKSKQTCLEKYGVGCVFQSEQIKEKSKKTNMQRHGNEYFSQTNEWKQKVKNTCIEKYGTENAMQNPQVFEKMKKTNLSKYGSEYFSQTNEWKNITEKRKKLYEFYNENDAQKIADLKDRKWTDSQIAQTYFDNVVSGSLVCKYRNHFNIKGLASNKSSYEYRIREILDANNINYVANPRNIITPYELDIYIPNHNLAIEVNGIYWHSHNKKETKEEREYHLTKRKMCELLGIKLIQFWDSEIDSKWNIVKSMILDNLGLNVKIGARKCHIIGVSTEEYRKFCNENHIQGYACASVVLGLEYDNELVSIMSFGKSRYNKKVEWELIRSVNKVGYQILGGPSKMFSHFINNNRPSTVVSYCDMRLFTGGVYKRLGFHLDHISLSNYFYCKNKGLESRQKYQKHKLNKVLDNFDPNLPESVNMFNNGYRRIWDCGNIVFIWSDL